MRPHLTFALVAPLAAFGELALGEIRPSQARPTRSGLLGLVAACLGVERSDEAAHLEIERCFGLGVLTLAPGRMSVDYHTVQFRVPGASSLTTRITRRQYREDVWHLGALWEREASPWSLEQVAEAMRRPVFAPYLGRACCPLALPLAPRIIQVPNAEVALKERAQTGPENTVLSGRRGKRLLDVYAGGEKHQTLALDEADAASLTLSGRVEQRLDALRSRVRRQYDSRAEFVAEIPR
ncbi:type I-E CRISPR-associated protein Cas5/CasD [Sabulicella rubraurantiaca]|uniref:type I-E CRISPR-associated protein Cas5/CasD n=1 Tax=Sabulicella rubraurantiaca TaxID=2811429 RepID=UPI001A9641BB|nr:type I-E CRISPR-associated protein Cas5/CasD [Sabulicella rubraurantiaca]